ncbi:MAG: helix-turn-helix transcriptional regulator [Clostridia bacterium]|nr:helix-turn-helix transcriptional regulator [Clostridia bacterium]
MDLINIQKRLRESISESKYTQKEIAQKIGVSPQTISKYMKNNIFPALDTLAKICKLLDVKSDYILGLSDY